MTLGEELLQDQVDRLEQDNRLLVEKIVAANKVLNEFRSKLRDVPSFSVLPKLTRTKLSEAHSLILNLDAVGNPLCVCKLGASDTAPAVREAA